MGRGSKRYVFILMVGAAALAALWVMVEMARLSRLARTHGNDIRKALDGSSPRAPSVHLHLAPTEGPAETCVYVDGLVGKRQLLTAAWFAKGSQKLQTQPQGTDAAGGKTEWRGVPLAEISKLAVPRRQAAWIRVEGSNGSGTYVKLGSPRHLNAWLVTKITSDLSTDTAPMLPALVTIDQSKLEVHCEGTRHITYVARPPKASKTAPRDADRQ